MHHVCYFAVSVAVFALCLTNAELHNITFPKPQCDTKERASTLLDVAKDFMNKAKDLYPDCIDDGFHCGRKEKSLAFLEVASNLISEVKNTFPSCPETKCLKILPKPMDCSEILQSGNNKNGVYTIWPRSRVTPNKGVAVYCDMDTDGGGWTVIQRRGNFSTPNDYFFKDWKNYKIGFGDLNEEFWLGNDNIYAISNQANYTIRFDLKDSKGVTGYAQYDTFWIEDEHLNYTLRIGGYKGTVGDSMLHHNYMKFSTKDRDNDIYDHGNCANIFQGAWWYTNCIDASLNGLYKPGREMSEGILWKTWRDSVSMAGAEMKVRPQSE